MWSSMVPTHTQVPTSAGAAVPAGALLPPHAEYAELIRDSDLFSQKLHAFHASASSKGLRIPTFGGAPLDLHLLFVEVTKRGGFDKVVAEHGWRELSHKVCKHQSSSSSHYLKKHYEMLLRAFEKVYFRNGTSISAATDRPTLQPGSSISGVIQGKCEWGYLVTMDVGNEKIQGVMYHVPEDAGGTAESQGQVVPSDILIRPEESTADEYRYFYEEMKEKLKRLYGPHEIDMNKKILLMWNNLSEEEKQGWKAPLNLDSSSGCSTSI